MALTITKLKMWKDPGYTRGCLEVPPAGSKKLPAVPDYSTAASETLRPHKGSTLTELHLPLAFSKVFDMSYLYMEATDGAGTVKLFGWIDSIDQRSSSAEGVTIYWTVDWWRSFSGSAVFGKGRMIRTSDSSKRRPSEFTPRTVSATIVKEISAFYQSTIHQQWCYFRCVATLGGVSNAFLFTFPIGANFGDGNSPAKTGMSITDIYAGALDENLNITSTTITGIWISNIPPANYAYDSNLGQFITPNATVSHASYGAIKIDEISQITYYFTIDIGSTIMTDDMTTYVITDASGRTIGTVPWGKSFRYIHVQNDIGSVSASYNITLSSSSSLPGNRISAPEGMQFKVPLINVPLTSNAWTDYNFSGQRDHDIEIAKMQNEQQMWNGFMNVGTSAVGGAVAGSIAGAGVAGAIAGAGIGIASPALNYALNEMYRDKTQGAVDTLYSKQANNLIIPAEGCAWMMSGTLYASLVRLDADSQSASDYSQMITNDGYNCDCPLNAAGSAAAIAAGGPLKIINFNITGSIPPAAKQNIKFMLESGVRIVENNPSGVAP